MICGIDWKHCALFVFGNAKWIVKAETSNFMEFTLKAEKNIIFSPTPNWTLSCCICDV